MSTIKCDGANRLADGRTQADYYDNSPVPRHGGGGYMPEEMVKIEEDIFRQRRVLALNKVRADRMRAGRWATTVGLFITVTASGTELDYLLGGGGSDGLSAALLFLQTILAVAGVNMIAAGVFLTCTARPSALTALITKAAAFGRQNLVVVGVTAASSATTGVVASAGHPVLCFGFFALFVGGVSLVTIGLGNRIPDGSLGIINQGSRDIESQLVN